MSYKFYFVLDLKDEYESSAAKDILEFADSNSFSSHVEQYADIITIQVETSCPVSAIKIKFLFGPYIKNYSNDS